MGVHTPSHSQPTSAPLTGSLWDPNITVETLEAHQLRVSFTLWNESSHYQILLNSFPHMEDHSCFEHIQQIPAPKQEEFHQRANLTLPLHSSNWCCRHRVQVQPFFNSCLNDCLRHTTTIPCPDVPETSGRRDTSALGCVCLG
uniref:Uncharacterized protein n=1 Tax=Marmota marmota marmota TaxID=9994 RepID=A0A8C6A9W3_MARMA